MSRSSILRMACCVSSVAIASACAPTSYDDSARFGGDISEAMHLEEITAVEDMPQEGTATYLGYGGYNTNGDHAESLTGLEVLGRLDMGANFSDSTISGEMYDFRDHENNQVAGRIEIANGTIFDNTLEADLNGEITSNGETSTVDGGMWGQFRGESAQYIDAYIYGTFTVGEEVTDFGGLVAAEKN